MTIDELISSTIPIYTLNRLNPRTGRPDCNLTRDYKLRLRDAMRKELTPLPEDKRKEVVERYKEKTKEL